MRSNKIQFQNLITIIAMVLNHLFANIVNILMIRNNLLNKASVQDVLGHKIKNDKIEFL
jgi:hypothetical protein